MPTLRNGKTTSQERLNGHQSKHNESGKEHLVIVGSGWAGYAVMQKLDRSRYTITMSASTSARDVSRSRRKKKLTSLSLA